MLTKKQTKTMTTPSRTFDIRKPENNISFGYTLLENIKYQYKTKNQRVVFDIFWVILLNIYCC